MKGCVAWTDKKNREMRAGKTATKRRPASSIGERNEMGIEALLRVRETALLTHGVGASRKKGEHTHIYISLALYQTIGARGRCRESKRRKGCRIRCKATQAEL